MLIITTLEVDTSHLSGCGQCRRKSSFREPVYPIIERDRVIRSLRSLDALSSDPAGARLGAKDELEYPSSQITRSSFTHESLNLPLQSTVASSNVGLQRRLGRKCSSGGRIQKHGTIPWIERYTASQIGGRLVFWTILSQAHWSLL